MYELDPLKTQKWIDDDNGARFLINALSAEEHNELRKVSKDKNGNPDVIVFGEKAAKKVISDWEGVGNMKRDANKNLVLDEAGKPILEPQPADGMNKLKFGRRFAYTVVPWLVEQARALDEEITQAEQDAKNV